MLNTIVKAALVATLSTAVVGQLPRLVKTVRLAQLQLLKDSETKKWGRPFLLPVQRARQPKSRSLR